MVGMIRPLVKGSSGKAIEALGLFWLGALMSSAFIGAAFSAAGLLIRPVLALRYWWVVIAGVAIVLAMADLGIGGLRTPGFRRQTYSFWWQTLGPSRAWLAWGAHLGLGVATIRATSIYWLVIAMVILITPIAAGPVVLIAYSVGLAAGLGMVVIANRFLDLQDGGARLLFRTRTATRRASSIVLMIIAVMAAGSAA
jgi:hypothetical protein